MQISWDPLIVAGLVAAVAAGLYHFTGWARTAALFVAAALAALVVAVPPLSRLAHHPVSSGFPLLVVIVGAVIFAFLFVVVVIRGHHDKPLRKPRRSSGGQSGAGTQGAVSPKSAHPKAAHHRAIVVTVGAMAFIFALVTSWHPVAHAVQHGVSQTYNGITQ